MVGCGAASIVQETDCQHEAGSDGLLFNNGTVFAMAC